MRRIVFVDDEPAVLDGLRRLLRPLCSEWNMTFVGSADEVLALILAETVDAVVSDVCMPGTGGLALLRAIREIDGGASVAVVMLTGTGNELTAVEAMKSGAQDYLIKGQATRELIHRGVESAIAAIEKEREVADQNEKMARLSVQLAEANVALSQASRLDSMTGLLNRQAWEEAATLEQDRSSRHGHSYAVIMIDVDHFKRLNDTVGHQNGDSCLRSVARCLAESTRAIDMVARYGGEEFVVLAPETDVSGAMVLAERVRRAIWDLSIPHPSSATADRVTVSIGVASGLNETWEKVVGRADDALYVSKRSGRNQVNAAADFDAAGATSVVGAKV